MATGSLRSRAPPSTQCSESGVADDGFHQPPVDGGTVGVVAGGRVVAGADVPGIDVDVGTVGAPGPAAVGDPGMVDGTVVLVRLYRVHWLESVLWFWFWFRLRLEL